MEAVLGNQPGQVTDMRELSVDLTWALTPLDISAIVLTYYCYIRVTGKTSLGSQQTQQQVFLPWMEQSFDQYHWTNMLIGFFLSKRLLWRWILDIFC